MKKMIATFLAFALILQSGAFASAKNYEDENMSPTVEVEELNGVRTAVSSDDYAEYTISFDKNEMSLSITVKDLSTGTENSTTVHANDIKQTPQTRASSSIYTTSLYAYRRTKTSTGTEWYLQRPKIGNEGKGSYYFKCWQNASNGTKLTLFRNAVETLSEREAALAGAAGAQAASLFITGILGLLISAGTAGLAATAIGALISSLALTGPSVSAARAVSLQCNTCFERIEDVYYATDNMHF